MDNKPSKQEVTEPYQLKQARSMIARHIAIDISQQIPSDAITSVSEAFEGYKAAEFKFKRILRDVSKSVRL